MRTVGTLITSSLVALTLSSCGGGGGGGGGSAGMPTPPSPIPAGTFLAGTGGNFNDSAASLSFTGFNVTSSTSTSNGAQISLSTDPTTGQARFLNLNVPTGSGSNYVHTFDLSTAVATNSLLPGFVGVKDGAPFIDGSSPNTIILDQTLTFSSFGIWVNVQSVSFNTGTNVTTENGAAGAIAFGSMTPAAGIPISGNATYSGRALGISSTTNSQSLLAGTVTLNANFTAMTINGTLNLNDVTNGIAFANLTMPSTSIASGAGGAYNGTLTGSLPTGAVTSSAVNGHFYGPVANETAGTFAATDGTTHVVGGFGAKKQ
jgi:hypothetical protein